MKFYARDFENIKYENDTGKVWLKFGITHHGDAEKRFDESVDDGYEKNYQDWKGDTAFSWNDLTNKQAVIIERHMLEQVFPNPGHTKVWVEKTLKCDDIHEYDTCSGITELRLITQKQRKWVLFQLYALRNGDHDKLSEAFLPLVEKLNANVQLQV